MTSYNDLSVHELLDICYSIVIGQSLDNRALLAVSSASYGTHTLSVSRAFYKVQVSVKAPKGNVSCNYRMCASLLHLVHDTTPLY